MKKPFKVGDQVMVTLGSITTHYGKISFIDPQDKEHPYQVEFHNSKDGIFSSGWFKPEKVHSIVDKNRDRLIKALAVCGLFISLILLCLYVYRLAYQKGQQNGLNQGYKLRQVEEAFERFQKSKTTEDYVYPRP